MIRDLMFAGRELAGYADPRVRRGLRWSMLEAVFAALPCGLVYLLLLDVLRPQAGADPVWRAVAIAAAMLACLALRMACAMRAMPAIFSGAYAMMGRARLRVADHLSRLPAGRADARTKRSADSPLRDASMSAALVTDLQLVEDSWAHFLGMFAGGLVVPVLLSLALLWLDWQLALWVLASAPLALLCFIGSQRVLLRQGARLLRASAGSQAEVLDYVQGMAVVRSFGRNGPAWQRVRRALAGLRRASIATDLWPAPLVGVFGIAVEAGFALVVWTGARRFGDGSLSPETLLLFAVLSWPIYRQLFEVGIALLTLRHAQQAMMRIRNVLSQAPLPEPVAPTLPAGHDIVFEQVGFAYPGEASDGRVLDEVSLRIAPDSLTAIVGPSGAGKSTLLSLIARLWEVDTGAIRIGGVDLRDIGSAALHARIGMVFQDVVLFECSVLDNLRIGRADATREQAVVAAKQAEAHDFILALPQGYDTQVGENGARLSGGERQRLSIARALLKDAPILLLDEATASVDPSAEASIQRALSALVHGRTVVVIAHRLHAVQHADCIVVMDAGRVVAQGRHVDLLAAEGVYARLWRHQQLELDWSLGGAAALG